jgi:uncharacterized membrane protein YdcZ (DUF606 family)
VVSLATMIFASVVLGFHFPWPHDFAHVPPYLFAGGYIPAGFIVRSLALKFGAGSAVPFVVSAQLIMAAAVDGRGLLGATVRPLIKLSLVGLGFAPAGMALARFAAAGTRHVP